MQRIAFILLAFTLVSACKIRVVVPDNGQVVNESGSFFCAAGAICDIDVVDVFFNEVFLSQPDAGHRFSIWAIRERGLCGGSASPCALSTAGFVDFPALLGLLNSDEVFYLQPRNVNLSDLGQCTEFSDGSVFCDQGEFPTCEVSLDRQLQLSVWMTYGQVVELFGCHGVLESRVGGLAATYIWGDDSSSDIRVSFALDAQGVPRVPSFGLVPDEFE